MIDQQSILEQADAAMRTVKNAIAELNKNIVSLERRKSDLEKNRSEIYNLPLSYSDIRGFLSDLIDFRASVYENFLQSNDFVNGIATPREREGLRFNQEKKALSLGDVEHALGKSLPGMPDTGKLEDRGWKLPVFLMGGEFSATWAYFFLGDLMKEKLGRIFPEEGSPAPDQSHPAAPLSIAQRREAIADINQELHEIAQELSNVRGKISALSGPVFSGAQALKGRING